jgi:LacI family transcriptional regulator
MGHSTVSGYTAMGRMMANGRRPTAVFAANDSLAIGALRWCLANGVRVPQDVAIIGFDNIEFAEYASVPLSTVKYAADVVSRMAVDRLMRLISEVDALPEPEVTLIDPEVIVRESTVAG